MRAITVNERLKVTSRFTPSRHQVDTASEQLVAESLEVGPFGKQLFSSDAWGPAELHYLGALLWRRALSAVLGRWIQSGDWSLTSALRVTSLIARDNARRLYQI